MRHRRKWLGVMLLVMLGLLVLAGQVSASEALQGDECIIAADEIIESDLYVICNSLLIEGTVQGDLIGGAWGATIAAGGTVEGDVWLVGGQLRIDGAVADDIRFAGVDLDITGEADLQPSSDVSAFALNVEVWDRATIPGDVNVFGYQAIIRGNVNRDVNFNGSALVLAGAVDGDVYASVGSSDTSPSFIPFPFPFSVSFQTPGLTVQSDGRIGGDLNYSGPRPGNINGRITGEINFTLDLPRPDITQTSLETEEMRPGDQIARYLNAVLADVLSLMAAGVLIMAIAPAWVREPAKVLPRQAPSSFGWGLIGALLSVPISLILVLVSILFLVLVSMITLGGFTWMGLLLLIIINAIVIGGFVFVILFMARLVISDLIGRWISRRLFTTGDRMVLNLLALLIGVTVYSLLTNIPLPWVGTVVYALGIFLGLGAIMLHARQLYQRMQRANYPVATGSGTSAAPELPAPRHTPGLDVLLGNAPEPPPDSGDPLGPGMTNLPDGFEIDWLGKEGPKRG
jgi:hypothetical protein